jgi:O-antigen/teichoic acid export membrane protein
MDVFFVGLLRGPEEVGGYGAAVRLLLAATLVHEAVGQVFVGRMGELFLRRDWPAIRSLYRATCVWTSWSAAGVVLLLVVWAPQVLGLFGEDYAASAGVLVVLAGARLVKTLTGHSGLLIVTTRRVRLHLFNALVLLASNAALNAAWVPEHGAEGAAAATLASVCLGNLLFLVEGQLFLSLLPFSARSLAAPALALSIGLVVWPLRAGAGGDLGWLLPAGAVALLWAGLAYAIALREPERRALVGLLRRPGARGEAAA